MRQCSICGVKEDPERRLSTPMCSARAHEWVEVQAGAKEAVRHPPHYGGGDNPYEVIKVIDAWGLDFCLGNTAKYIARAGKKTSDLELQDLKKAKWYLDHKIEMLEKVDTKCK